MLLISTVLACSCDSEPQEVLELVNEVQLRNSVVSMEYSNDSRLVAIVDEYDRFSLLDTAKLEVLAVRGFQDDIPGCGFSNDDNYVAAISHDGSVIVWSTADFSLQSAHKHGDAVYNATFDPDSELLASASIDTTVRVIECATGAEVVTLEHDSYAWDTRFSPDGQLLVTISDGYTLDVFDTSSWERIVALEYETKPTKASFSPDSQRMVTDSGVRLEREGDNHSAANGCVRLYDTTSWQQLAEFSFKWFPTTDISPDGRYFAAHSDHGECILADIETGAVIAEYMHEERLHFATFSPDSRYLATRGFDKLAIITESATGEVVKRVSLACDIGLLKFSPDSQYLAILDSRTSFDGRVLVLRTTDWTQVYLENNTGIVYGPVFSQDSRYAVFFSRSYLYLVDLGTGLVAQEMSFDRRVTNCCISPDGEMLLVATGDGQLRAYRFN
jgi:WD40 repeat protein